MRIFTFVWTVPLSKAGRYVRNNGELLWNPKHTVQRVLVYLMYEMHSVWVRSHMQTQLKAVMLCKDGVVWTLIHKHTGFLHLVGVTVASGQGGEKWHGTWRHGKPCWKTKNYKTHPRRMKKSFKRKVCKRPRTTNIHWKKWTEVNVQEYPWTYYLNKAQNQAFTWLITLPLPHYSSSSSHAGAMV